MRNVRGSRISAIARAMLVSIAWSASSLEPSVDTSRGDGMIDAYFKSEAEELAKDCLADIQTVEDWTARQAIYRRQLHEMLGLDPLPERTPLAAVVWGRACYFAASTGDGCSDSACQRVTSSESNLRSERQMQRRSSRT
jgi:hypothetical protein